MPHWITTWVDWWGARFALSWEPSCENNGAVEIQFAVRYFKPNESALRKLCTNINQPYLIWAADSLVMFLQHRTMDTGANNPTDQGVDKKKSMTLLLLLMMMTWGYSKDEVRPAN